MATRNEWYRGESATFTYGLSPDPTSEISNRLAHRDGQVVTILNVEDPFRVREELPTLAERIEAGEVLIYGVRFPDGHTDTAFEDELTEVRS